MPVYLPRYSQWYADNSYTGHEQEDLFGEGEQIELRVCRKADANRKDEPYLAFLKNNYQKGIETTFSDITSFFPKKIHAITAQEFILKIILFIFDYTLNQLL